MVALQILVLFVGVRILPGENLHAFREAYGVTWSFAQRAKVPGELKSLKEAF